MWMVRNNERVEETEGNEWGLGGDVLQLMLRRGRPYIHCMDVCGECMCVYCTVLERGSKGRQIWRGEQRKKENQKTWLKIFFFFFYQVSFLCSLSPFTAVSRWILIQHGHMPSVAFCNHNRQHIQYKTVRNINHDHNQNTHYVSPNKMENGDPLGQIAGGCVHPSTSICLCSSFYNALTSSYSS